MSGFCLITVRQYCTSGTLSIFQLQNCQRALYSPNCRLYYSISNNISNNQIIVLGQQSKGNALALPGQSLKFFLKSYISPNRGAERRIAAEQNSGSVTKKRAKARYQVFTISKKAGSTGNKIISLNHQKASLPELGISRKLRVSASN